MAKKKMNKKLSKKTVSKKKASRKKTATKKKGTAKKRPKRKLLVRKRRPGPLLKVAGKPVDRVPVELSYHIIRHFSAGLYTSPNKAVEELVANSYDAWADKVYVILPENLAANRAKIAVIDNGESMDVDGFRRLWMIGESLKRQPGLESKERPPIGKFGIGKLATYVLAKELTYICKHGGKYRAITMDFALLEDQPQRKRLRLVARELTEKEAQTITGTLVDPEVQNQTPNLFGTRAPDTWTIAVMSNLTQLARRLSKPTLERVLRTALPINPQFRLYLNGERLQPVRVDAPTIDVWVIGENDKAAEKLKFMTGTIGGKPYVDVPGLGRIVGSAQLYVDPVTRGKSEIWGRSHGYFVMVRQRLINLHQELFGLPALSHGAFSRFRMEVHADGLDDYLRSTREDVAEEEEGVINFRAYLKAKFDEARAKYGSWIATREAEESITGRVSGTPRSLSRQPLINAISQVLDGKLDDLLLTRIPDNLTEADSEQLIEDLRKHAESDEFYSDVSLKPLGIEEGLALFDTATRAIWVNSLHPYFANYAEHYRSHEPFELLAMTEVLTEAYMIEMGIDSAHVREVMLKRDRFLRELVFSKQLSAPLVAQLLRDNRAQWKGLESATCKAFGSLGFEVSPIGGSGQPDGQALARLGVRDPESGKSSDYKIIFDSKSTAAAAIAAGKVDSGRVTQHRTDTSADFAVVVAPAFQGDGHRDSNAVKQAQQQGITLITLNDLARLVILAATRPLSLARLREEFFEQCRGPRDATQWINKLQKEKPPDIPLQPVLDEVWEMMKEGIDAPKFATIADRLRNKYKKTCGNIREGEIKELLLSVRRLEPNLVTIEGDRVYIDNAPEIVAGRLRGTASGLPNVLQYSIYDGLLGDLKPKRKKQPKRKAKSRKTPKKG